MDSIRQQTRRSVQSLTSLDREVGVGLLFNLIRAGEIMPPWWSRDRDRRLREMAVSSDHFQGAAWMISTKLCNVPFRVQPRDRSIKLHQKLADRYQALCENMLQFGAGWGAFWSRFLADLWFTDNGAFAEVIGGGRPGGPLKGPAVGLAHLDSMQCTRTSNPEFPVKYQDFDGKIYKFHHTRVIFTSQYPDPRAQMFGVGHCWLSRALNNVQQLIDGDVYYQEALGSRPLRQMLLGRGIHTDDLIRAIRLSEESMDNQKLTRYAKTAFIGDPHRTDIGIDTIPFTFLPDGYNKQEQTSIGMSIIAVTGGFPVRWLWPMTATGATKADAMYQHIAGAGGGALWHLNMMSNLLSYSDVSGTVPAMLPPKFIPKELKLVFDFQDDEQDRQQAEIRDRRASTRKTDIETGVITVRVAREQALESGDITPAQFAQMELADGNLPEGDDILTLFDSADPLFIEMLDLGVDEPLAIDLNDAVEMMIAIEAAALSAQTRMVQARSTTEKEKARQAIEALGKLKDIYSELVERELEEEIAAEQQAGEFELPETTAEAPGEGETAEETEEEAPEVAPKSKSVTDRLLGRMSYDEAVDALVDLVWNEATDPTEYKELIDDYLYDITHDIKAFKFGARVGERIRGGLFRGRGGRFASEADVSAIKSEILGRLIARLRAARGLGGKGGKKGAAKKPKKGGGGGGKKKPSPAELARQKAEAERKARAETWASMDDVDAAEMESLADFIAGGELDRATAESLAGLGFVEFDDRGQAQATSAGRAVISAATKGDKRRVSEAMSRGRERVAKVQARASKKREQAETARERAADYQQRAEDATGEADELDDQADDLLAEADAEEDAGKAEKIRERAAKLQERAEKKREQAAGYIERASEQDERAVALDADATAIEATIGVGEMTEEALPAEPPAQSPEPAEQPPGQAEPTPAKRPAPEPSATPEGKPDVQTQLLQAISETGATGRMDPASLIQLALAGLIEQTPDGIKLTTAGEDELKKKDIDGFALNVRANIRGLWNGDFDRFDFVDGMISAIERGFNQAWNEGAAKCGIQPNERTPEEESELRDIINEQFPHLPGFAADIDAGSKANGGALQPFLDRGDLWIRRYSEVVTRAQAMACANQKLKWKLGIAEHCRSCLKLADKVKRASYWHERGILPRVAGASYLECNGYRCDCRFEETDEPVSRGPLPGLP